MHADSHGLISVSMWSSGYMTAGDIFFIYLFIYLAEKGDGGRFDFLFAGAFFAAEDGGTNEVVFHSQNHPVTSILSFLVSYHSSPSAVR